MPRGVLTSPEKEARIVARLVVRRHASRVAREEGVNSGRVRRLADRKCIDLMAGRDARGPSAAHGRRDRRSPSRDRTAFGAGPGRATPRRGGGQGQGQGGLPAGSRCCVASSVSTPSVSPLLQRTVCRRNGSAFRLKQLNGIRSAALFVPECSEAGVSKRVARRIVLTSITFCHVREGYGASCYKNGPFVSSDPYGKSR
jgi:hypothetical protein